MKTGNVILLGWFLLGLPVVTPAQFACTTNNGALTITGYTGTNGDVTIPDTIGGLPVTRIAGLFSFTSLTNVTVPDSVTNIASGAFYYHSQLTAIVVNELNAYYSSSNGVLFDKQQTELMQAPGGLAGRYAIPATVATIDDNAFNSCAGLSGITIPDSVTNIGSQAFEGCSGLTNVSLGPDLLHLGSDALADCQNLTAIVVDGLNPAYSSVGGVLFDRQQGTLIQAPGGMVGSYVIPAGVTSLGAGALAYCYSLTNVMVPDSVTNIGSQAFYGCSRLTNLTLGTNVMSIGDYALSSCSDLTSLAIPNRVTSLGTWTFANCGSLAGITLGTNVASIGDNVFYACSSLAALSVPNSVTNLGNYALAYCGSLTNVTLGNQVASLGNAALRDCARLTSLVIPASVTNLGNAVFDGCGSLAAIVVDGQNPALASAGGVLYNKPQTTLIQVPGAFVGSYALPDSVTNIVNGALAGCGGLTAITVGGANPYFTAINGVLFDKPLTTLIQFPGGGGGSYSVSNGITRLGSTAFSGCSNLISLTVPASVTNVGNTTFAGSPHAGIYFQGNAPGITTLGPPGIHLGLPLTFLNSFYSSNSEAVYYLPGTTGWGGTFDGLAAYLWLPPYVCTPASNSITINGFNGSGNSLVIPDTMNGLPVTSIASGVFDNATGYGLTNVVLGANLTMIGSYAFAACANLTSITLPSGVTNLGSCAFAFCDNLKSVYFQGNAPGTGSAVFFQWSGFPIFPPVYEPPTPTTVYYLPGTTGWGATFAGQPAVLWNPQALASDVSFGVRTNVFGFNVTGASNLVVVVEACTNLVVPDWQPVQTITLASGSACFRDPQWTNNPGRFYRFRSP